MADTPRLKWIQFAGPGLVSPYHLARVELSALQRTEPHRHDFAELFVVERGRGIHAVNAGRQALARGDMVFIRPDDAHGFIAGPTGLVFVNLAVPLVALAALQRRYFGETRTDWPWDETSALPRIEALSLLRLERMGDWAERLAGGSSDALMRDALLLDVLSGLGDGHAGLPDWLARAARRFATTERFTGGAGRLAALAQRSPEHVNRTLRARVGLSTTDYINAMRVEHAARRLRLSDATIAEIADECGVTHLTYFYRIFRARTGLSPSRYRRAQRMGMD